MVLGLLTITAIPTVTGVAQGVSEQKRQNQQKVDAKRMEKFCMDVTCEDDNDEYNISGKRVVLRDEKAYLDDPNPSLRSLNPSHTAQAFYITYPETEETKAHPRGLGLVTTVSDDPPMLNWLYADKDTHEVKYGNRTQSIAHVVGPWDWTNDETGVTLEKKDRFVAVEEEDGKWAIYFDRDADKCQRVLAERGLDGSKIVTFQIRRKMLEQAGGSAG
ncbi:hypothetical protein DTO166G4_8440 [Paecilomyces variotii]|nr:hypothetical protein DTO166G4_8440 [Paecilomyces variotii]KAJ9229840.1 hypothetical protein DTO166G5_7655 [Paecilomyces variotii]KAJ9248303.1 hypothetical protein DTO207G8_7478 [Paecilomyces variotii]KAJ9253130.1 hypothetical protein DTO195F2_7191 [Paecilomyces variotii]KAJ9307113.1 hypothetical protein DTO217A2_3351 [Paecilomyces variotii]